MIRRQPFACLPEQWLISDARNDHVLEAALMRLPRGSGLIFRHYHLAPEERRARFEALGKVARRMGHCVILAGDAPWRADGTYGPPARSRAPAQAGASGDLAQRRNGLRPPPARGRGSVLVTAHSLREIAAARRAGADAIVLSSVFPTRSHPGGKALGPARFRLLAARAGLPVIALGGMTPHRARALRWRRWAAIDGLSPQDS